MIHKSFKIIFSLFIMLVASVLSMSAQQVSKEAALSKAEQFFNQSDVVSRRASKKTPLLTLANDRNEFFVFNDEANGGYVVVAGDERMPDVLGYSYTGHFDAENLPCNMKAWLEDYASQVEYLRTHSEAQVVRRTSSERKEISPMLKCHFRQSGAYNKKCPTVDGQLCPTGCTATAMAQIMYYYQWPKQTTDVIPGYTTTTLKIDMPAMPITTIDWDNILDVYESGKEYSEAQIDAISTLMLLCGTSIMMDYRPSSSGASEGKAAIAFSKYFNYDDIVEIIGRDVYLDAWEQMLYDELNDGRLVLLRADPTKGAGHAFVLDGYRDGYFHVDFGSGVSGDYFLLTNLQGYNYNQNAVVGIQPLYPDSPSRYAVLDNGKVTLYYDKERTHRSGTILPHIDDLSNYKEQITECVIDPSYSNLQPKNLSRFFEGWSQLKSIEGIENLNTSMAKGMNSMFSGCSSLTSLDLSSFKTDNVTDMSFMFSGCSSLTTLDVSGFKTDNVTNMWEMFKSCSSLTTLDLSKFKTDKVLDMRGMFCYCNSLTSLDVSGFNTEKITHMGEMFAGCSSLKSLDLSSFNTDNVTNMSYIFKGCRNLTGLDLSSFNTNNVTNMSSMFSGCSSLASLDLSSFKTDKLKEISSMFGECSSLTTVYVSERWSLLNAEPSGGMFLECKNLIGGEGTVWSTNHTGSDYAHIDEGASNPGYFTYKAPSYYTITYMIGDELIKTENVKVGAMITPPDAPEREGYTFKWIDVPETMPAHDVTVIGTFTEVEIEPVNQDEIVSFSDEINENTDLSDKVVENTYYNMDASNGDGYDTEEQALVLNSTTSATQMSAIQGADVSDNAVKENYSGIIFELAPGNGVVTVDVKTIGTHVLMVQIGNNIPTKVTKSERGTVDVSYDVSEPTYVYLYARTADGSAARLNRAGTAGANSVLLYGYKVTIGGTGINAIRMEAENGKVFDLNGRQVKTPGKGVYIINGRKVVVK